MAICRGLGLATMWSLVLESKSAHSDDSGCWSSAHPAMTLRLSLMKRSPFLLIQSVSGRWTASWRLCDQG